jgi:hypothetical protein
MIFDQIAFPTGNNDREKLEFTPMFLRETNEPALRVRVIYVAWSHKHQAYVRRYSETFISVDQVRELMFHFENHLTSCPSPFQCGHGGVDQITVEEGKIKVLEEFIPALKLTVIVPPKVEGKTPFTAITCVSYKTQNVVANWLKLWLNSIKAPRRDERLIRTLVKREVYP